MGGSCLLMKYVKPHYLVKTTFISRCQKTIMTEAGLNNNRYKAGSTG